MSLRGHVTWIVAVAVVAAVALPVLVFYTGQATLGPYAGDGLGVFVADYLADLARLRAGAWTLLLGPVAMVAAWRLIVAIAWPGRAASAPAASADSHRASVGARRDPTIGGLSRE
jgi:ABC-type branched-subunit amino acid transport system permease subunit